VRFSPALEARHLAALEQCAAVSAHLHRLVYDRTDLFPDLFLDGSRTHGFQEALEDAEDRDFPTRQLCEVLEAHGWDEFDSGCQRRVYGHPDSHLVIKIGPGEENAQEYAATRWLDAHGLPLAIGALWLSPNQRVLISVRAEHVLEPLTAAGDLSAQAAGEISDTFQNAGLPDTHHGNIGLSQGRWVMIDLNTCGARALHDIKTRAEHGTLSPEPE